ncbi:hypothetical protein SAMN05421690_103226 [Nitrosomonas sp. Nm51]|uniref:hypothetical protein n=1 Tax=Nitrosomonas sp. Nm51 TaxID=133720 RepID=UPI0008CD0031|nr:hypothetical protein [Nitrosomonas sp. Nm51]SER50811.1 hypothetical protein SAMN05421690_103226 [Nitrosomonas sp. Nm51]
MKLSIYPLNSKKFLIGSVAIGVVTVFLVLWLRLTDPHSDYAEQYLRSDPNLRESIGTIKKLSLKRTTTFFRPTGVGAAQEPDRKRYRFIVKGETRNVDVTVIVHISENDKVGSIEIENIGL